jgi:RNA ligase
MKFDINIINQYIERGLVTKNNHPSLPISIYNYTPTTQYEGKWDEITKMCRGLVLDEEGNVLAKPFNKFFNLEEHNINELPNESFQVFEKMDGSLGILFNYEGEWILATKGSFTSEQAIKGKEILKKYRYERLLTGFTYLFEIIYPENRIVLDYEGMEDLVLLAVIDNSDGYELDIHDENINLEGNRFKHIYKNLGFNLVKKYNGITDYSILGGMVGTDREGYVVKFKGGMRIKIKGEDYVRLHRIITNVTKRTIWEYLSEGRPFDELLERVPDEFYEWVKSTKVELEFQYYVIKREYRLIYNSIIDKVGNENRRNFAELAKTYKHPNILFQMLDDKNVENAIWYLIYPEHSKPFWKKEVDN